LVVGGLDLYWTAGGTIGLRHLPSTSVLAKITPVTWSQAAIT
jgi:hypothetical protein